MEGEIFNLILLGSAPNCSERSHPLAVIGPNGAGKSTVFSALNPFFNTLFPAGQTHSFLDGALQKMWQLGDVAFAPSATFKSASDFPSGISPPRN